MESSILEMLGFDPAYIFIALIVIIIILFIKIILTNRKLKLLTKKYETFMRGKDAETLEETIFDKFDQIDALIDSDNEKLEAIQKLFENLTVTYQKTGIVKYNAFKEMGGNLSFSLALLDKENDGFILNSMHSREGCYTYLKEIVKGESFVALAEEEKEALEKAINVDNYME